MDNSLVTPSETVEGSRSWGSFAGAKGGLTRIYPVLLRVAGLGLLLILLCVPIARDLLDLWWNRYGFSHGFLVPLVSLYFAWLQWPVLRLTPIAPSIGPGLLWLVSATALLLASEVAGILTTGSVALILLLAALVLLLRGMAHLRALAFPLAYLVFMTPLLDVLTQPLEWPFQLLTANMSVWMLQALGIPVLLENRIDIILPTVTLEVARECSGAGLLIAVLAIGFPLAYLTLRAWWSRLTLVASSIMIAVVANWVRLTVMGVYAQAGGKDLHGPYHILQGLLVDWVAFGFLFVGAWLLGRLERIIPVPVLPREPTASQNFMLHHPSSSRAWWLAFATVAAAALVLYSLDRGTATLKHNLATFPLVIGEWMVDHNLNDASPIEMQNVDDSLVRTYRRADGQQVHLYVAYTKAQRQGKELVGMQTASLHENAVSVALPVGEGSEPANRTVIVRSRRPIPALFWYHIDGASYTDRYQAKLATVKQALLRGRTDGALVLVSAEPRSGGSEEAWRVQEKFAGVLFPLMQEYLP